MKKLRTVMVILILLFTLTMTTYAESITNQDTKKLTNTTGENNVTIWQDDLYMMGNYLVNKLNIDGDAFALGQTFETTGDINGTLRVAGGIVRIKSQVTRNAFVAAKDFVLETDAVVGKSLNIFAINTKINGTVNKDILIFTTGEIEINGTINGNLYIEGADSLKITDNAKIAGNIEYNMYRNPDISKNATIGGETKGNIIDSKKEAAELESAKFAFKLFGFVTYIAFAMIAVFIFRKFFEKTVENLKQDPLKSILVGLGTCIVAILTIILLITSMVGILPGISIGLLFMLVLISNKIVVAIVVARKFVKDVNVYIAVIMGVALLDALMLIPGIQSIVNASIILFGTGAIVITLLDNIKTDKQNAE